MAKDDRLKISLDRTYAEVLGRATFCFAQLEWNAVYCCEGMKRGYLHTVRRKTAGQIAGDLVRMVRALTDVSLKARCEPAAEEFKRLVDVRNNLIHGNPATSPSGEQMIARDGSFWTSQLIDDAADGWRRA
jgi:hypothetical protein